MMAVSFASSGILYCSQQENIKAYQGRSGREYREDDREMDGRERKQNWAGELLVGRGRSNHINLAFYFTIKNILSGNTC